MVPLKHQERPIEKALEYLRDPKRTKPELIVAPTACHARGYKILMYNGSLKPVENIVVGDQVMGDNSSSRNVLEIHSGTDTMYKVILRNGTEFTVNKDHILHLRRTGMNNSGDKPWTDTCYPKEVNISVTEYLSWAKSRKHVYKLKRVGVEFQDFGKKLPLDPYFLGLWLGDGHKHAPTITSMDSEIENYIFNFAEKNNLIVTTINKGGKNRAKSYAIRSEKRGKTGNPLLTLMGDMGIINNKHVPFEYLVASREDRLKLLAGFIDSDGSREKGLNYTVTLKDEAMIDALYFLINSLGFPATKKVAMKSCTNCENTLKRKYFRLSFRGDSTIPILIKRRQAVTHKYTCSADMFAFKVEPSEETEYFGFTLDNNHLYLDENFIIQHNSGKSFIQAEIARLWGEPVLVLQPGKELLKQNIEKSHLLGSMATVYSASLNRKEVSHFTYATLGSVKKDVKALKAMGVRTVLIDEAHHTFSPDKGSQFMEFITELAPTKVIGLTATPFRLKSSMEGSELKLLTRMRPNYFKNWIDIIQIQDVIAGGWWSKIEYETHEFDETGLLINSSGAEYTEESVKEAIKVQGVNNNIYKRIKRLLAEGCPSALVFLDSIESCKTMVEWIPGSAYLYSGMSEKLRDQTVKNFKTGIIKVLFNFDILSTGFDYPDLRCVILGRPTMSLAKYYQIIGRGTRVSKHTGKESFLYIDYCNNVSRFGMVENLTLEEIPGWGWGIFNGDILLTNVSMSGLKKTKQDIIDKVAGKASVSDPGERIWFGVHKGKSIRDVPIHWIEFILYKSDFNWDNPKMAAFKKKMEAVLDEQKSKSFIQPPSNL